MLNELMKKGAQVPLSDGSMLDARTSAASLGSDRRSARTSSPGPDERACGLSSTVRVDESRALIVSEPSDRSPDWEQVPDRHIVCARPGHLIITPIPMGEQ